MENLLNNPQQASPPLPPNNTEQSFSPLRLRRKHLAEGEQLRYRVHVKGGESVVIEARTAYEAYRDAGVGDIVRIVREAPAQARLLKEEVFAGEEDYVETAAAQIPMEEGASKSEMLIQSPRSMQISRKQIVLPAPSVMTKTHSGPPVNTEAMKESVLQDEDVEVLPTGEVVKLKEAGAQVAPQIAAAITEQMDAAEPEKPKSK